MKAIHRKVLQLREQGKSYAEICQETGLAKSTVSYVLQKYFPAAKNSRIERKNLRFYHQSKEFKEGQLARKQAAGEFYQRKHTGLKEKYLRLLRHFPDQCFIYYVSGLYEGEGAHKGTEFSFCNSDPLIIKPFLRFLREVLQFPEDRFSLRLMLHASMSREKCVLFWEETCQHVVDYTDQYDSRPQKKVYRHNKDRTFYGTITVRVKTPNGIKGALAEYTY